MRFWTLLSGVALGLAIGAAARDGWMAVLFGVGAAFFWRASYCFPAEETEDGIESFRAARKALRGGE